jgi:hypothetical protein
VLAPPTVEPTGGMPVVGVIPVVVVPVPGAVVEVRPGTVTPAPGIAVVEPEIPVVVVDLHGPETVLMVGPAPVMPVEPGGPIGVGVAAGAPLIAPEVLLCPGNVVWLGAVVAFWLGVVVVVWLGRVIELWLGVWPGMVAVCAGAAPVRWVMPGFPVAGTPGVAVWAAAQRASMSARGISHFIKAPSGTADQVRPVLGQPRISDFEFALLGLRCGSARDGWKGKSIWRFTEIRLKASLRHLHRE